MLFEVGLTILLVNKAVNFANPNENRSNCISKVTFLLCKPCEIYLFQMSYNRIIVEDLLKFTENRAQFFSWYFRLVH